MKWKKYLIDGEILTVVFILAVILFSYITNKENNNMTADMGAATRPQVTFSYNGYALNSLPAYTREMDVTAVRDTVTPVTNGRLEMNLKAYDNTIHKLTYVVYTLDGENEILKKEVKNPKEEVFLEIEGEDTLTEERVLKLVLDLEGDKKVYLYTRIVDAAGLNALECLDYIRDFHENALDKVSDAGIGIAIEPNEEGDNTTFHHVTIHSDYDHVTWGELKPEVEGGERWSIQEINSTSTSVLLEYRVRCKGEENETDVYNVKEFFRVRHMTYGGNNYLLDYDRTMEQIFDASHAILNEKGLVLGIGERDVPYMVNKDGSIVSFIQANELWNYNKKNDEISLVFSFSDAENTDVRNLFSDHEVKLLEMDGDGNTVFAVYGYMNRGDHEGEVGIAIYYYNIEKNSVEEKAFISSNKSYERTLLELGKLVYYNVEQNTLYVLVDGTLYEIDVKKGRKEELAQGLSENRYVVSDDGHLAAYQMPAEEEKNAQIVIKNFNSGKERTVECADGEMICPLGFIKNDFVYGVAKTEDVGKTVSGQDVVPMYKIEIEDSKGKSIKTYEQNGYYVLNAEFEDNMITLERATKSGNTYTAAPEDYITNNEEKDESNIYEDTYVTELKETQRRITYADGIEDKEPKLLKPKQVLHEKVDEITFEDKDADEKCYVYGHGKLQGVYDSAGKAIQTADAYNGVVVSSRQTYIWERSNRDLEYSITEKDAEIESICTQLKNGKTPVEIMESISDGRYIDLTGCAAEQVLYVVNQGTPVIAMLDAGTSVVIVGYTDGTITYRDSENNENHVVSYEEMDNMTQGSGHAYVAYVK